MQNLIFIQSQESTAILLTDLKHNESGSLEEFSSLMQGQLVDRSMENDLLDSFAVFRSDYINLKQLKLMTQVKINSL